MRQQRSYTNGAIIKPQKASTPSNRKGISNILNTNSGTIKNISSSAGNRNLKIQSNFTAEAAIEDAGKFSIKASNQQQLAKAAAQTPANYLIRGSFQQIANHPNNGMHQLRSPQNIGISAYVPVSPRTPQHYMRSGNQQAHSLLQ